MLHSEVNIMRKDIDTLKNDVADLKQDINVLKSELRETKAELKGDILALNMRIDDLHQSQNKWFTLLGLLITIVPIAIATI